MSSETYDDEPEVQILEEVRVRRSTIERFNDELAVLDRPLENDVEYYDDPPPRSPWRRAVAVAGGAALVGGLAAFAVTHRWSSIARDLARPPLAAALPAVAPAAPPAVAPLAGPAAPVALNEAAAPSAKEERAGEDPPDVAGADAAGPWRLQPSRRAWANVKPAGHEKPARAPAPHARSRHHGRHR